MALISCASFCFQDFTLGPITDFDEI